MARPERIAEAAAAADAWRVSAVSNRLVKTPRSAVSQRTRAAAAALAGPVQVLVGRSTSAPARGCSCFVGVPIHTNEIRLSSVS